MKHRGGGGRISILLIEDNRLDIELIREMLKGTQGEVIVEVAERLSTGLERLAEGGIDLVLLDLGLPDSQGLDTLMSLRAQASEIAVVVLTALDDEAAGLEALKQGAQDYLIKGQVDGRLLGRAIRPALERKRAEKALRQSEEKYRRLFEQSREAIFVTNEAGNHIDFNQAALELYGYTREELLRVNANERYVNPGDRERFIQEVTAKGFVEEFEVKLRKKDGTEMLCLITSNLWRDPGEGVQYQGIVRDITGRQEAERKLQDHSEQLEEMVEERTRELREAQGKLVRKEKLAVLGRLAGGVGHDLRTPLSVITNAIYYLKMTNPDADEKTKEYLEVIADAVHSSDEIISELLEFARTSPPRREEVEASGLVADALEKHSPPENIQVTVDTAPDLPSLVVDPYQIKRVLTNLVNNAYQAMPEGGTLTITAREEEGGVRISVADTGVGISDEGMKHIFEPLYTTKSRGIGLGLATSQGLVEANRGTIEVESEAGEGSTFTVILPTE